MNESDSFDERAEELVRWAEGLFVGQLDIDEQRAFQRLCDTGKARRSYEGSAGFLGLAKVRLVDLTARCSAVNPGHPE